MQPVGERSMSWDGHLALVHDTERQRRAGVTAWVRRGLDLGSKVFYTERPHEPSDRSILGVLEGDGIDASALVESGQLQVFHAEDGGVYSPEWLAMALDQALADGYTTVRWSGEATTAWSVMTPGAHAEIEWTTDELCHTRQLSVLCQYPYERMETALQTVCAMHGDGLRAEGLQITRLPGGCAVAGEVDRSNATILSAALAVARDATGDGQGPLVVDLSGLAFLDVAGTRALVRETADLRAIGGIVTLRSVQPPVLRLLRLLGVDGRHGFVLEGS